MTFPATTGQVAELLGVPEPRLSDLIRRHKISPPPAIVVGRRQWGADHVRQAAHALGVPTPASGIDLATDALSASPA